MPEISWFAHSTIYRGPCTVSNRQDSGLETRKMKLSSSCRSYKGQPWSVVKMATTNSGLHNNTNKFNFNNNRCSNSMDRWSQKLPSRMKRNRSMIRWIHHVKTVTIMFTIISSSKGMIKCLSSEMDKNMRKRIHKLYQILHDSRWLKVRSRTKDLGISTKYSWCPSKLRYKTSCLTRVLQSRNISKSSINSEINICKTMTKII